MKAVKGYEKNYYMQETEAPSVKEFDTIQQAAEYLANKYGTSVEYMTSSIMSSTNCDAIYFDDGSVIIYEF